MYFVYYIQYLFILSITHSGIVLNFVTNYLQVIVYKYVESNKKNWKMNDKIYELIYFVNDIGDSKILYLQSRRKK